MYAPILMRNTLKLMASADAQLPIAMLGPDVSGYAPLFQPLTIAQVEQMVKFGILEDGAPLELIDGILVRKDRSSRGEDPMTHNPAHANCVSRLLWVLSGIQAQGFHFRCQLPLALRSTRAPEPDVAIIRGSPLDYGGRHPGPNDVVAVIEVADGSLAYDRRKQRLYAEAGIPTYWIVNLVDNRLEVYEQPNLSAGKYHSETEYGPADVVELALDGHASIDVRVFDVLTQVA